MSHKMQASDAHSLFRDFVNFIVEFLKLIQLLKLFSSNNVEQTPKIKLLISEHLLILEWAISLCLRLSSCEIRECIKFICYTATAYIIPLVKPFRNETYAICCRRVTKISKQQLGAQKTNSLVTRQTNHIERERSFFKLELVQGYIEIYFVSCNQFFVS